MKQTSHKKGAAWGSRLMIAAALLATVCAGLLASPPAIAQSVPPVQPVPGDPNIDPGTGCPWWDYDRCAHMRGFDTGSPTATASPTPTATSTTSPAAKDQYKVPDTAADSSTATASPTASPTASATTSPGTQLPPSGGYSLRLVAALALVAFGAVALVLVLVRRAAS
jgi:hypothetical protein